MLRLFFAAALAAVVLACEPAAPDAKPSPPRLEIVDFESAVFDNARKLRIWLPPGYDNEADRHYPVLYMNDGQTLFDTETANMNPAEWRFDETAGALINQGEIEKLIVVGVDNPGLSKRPDEYLPFEDEYLTPPVPNPHGADYPVFLFDEIIPFVEQHYRADPKRRSLGGASYGGLISVYAAASRGGALEALLIESPSLYVDGARILTIAEDASDWPKRVYIGVGTHEGRNECREDNAVKEAVIDVKRLESIIQETSPDTDVFVVVEECGLHHEDYWARRLPDALEFLFPVQP